MSLRFTKLSQQHLPLLLKWLSSPHVQKWWDKDVDWSIELIHKRYDNYIQGYKILNIKEQEIKAPMHAYIIEYNETPIGYIQYYDKRDFPSEQGYGVSNFPNNCAAIDLYIGETDYIGKGIGGELLERFVTDIIDDKFKHIFLDPEIDNKAAIRCYEKLGFEIKGQFEEVVFMFKEKTK